MTFNDYFAALSALFATRVYEDNFPQVSGDFPVPAARVTQVGGVVFEDLCGVDITTAEPRWQVDVVAATAKLRNALVPQVIAAVQAMTVPARLQGLPTNLFDAETKRYRAILIFVSHQSSE